MRESGYYPMGAEHDLSAPYNQKEPPPITQECSVRQTMYKTVELETTNYNVVKGEDGCAEYELGEIDWVDEFVKQHMTIQNLLIELKKYVEHDLSMSQTGRQRYRLKWILQEIAEWNFENIEVEEE